MSSVFLRATVVWFLLTVIAVAAGVVRTILLVPAVGESMAHVVGTLAVVAVFTVVIWRAAPWMVPDLAHARLVRIGLGWTAATVAFEFGFGHYIAGHSWEHLLADYNVARGRLWVLVLITLLAAPPLAGRRPGSRPKRQCD